MNKLTLPLFSAAFLLISCGTDAPEEEGTLDEEFCEHMKEGPAEPITATAAATGAPDATADHTRVDITLVPVTAMNGGTVTYAAHAAGDYALALSKDVPLVIKKASDGSIVAFESSEGQSAICSEVAARHHFELAVGTYNLELGPTAESAVSMVVEEAAHAHD